MPKPYTTADGPIYMHPGVKGIVSRPWPGLRVRLCRPQREVIRPKCFLPMSHPAMRPGRFADFHGNVWPNCKRPPSTNRGGML